MGDEAFPHDVFLSHSANDKAVVRPLAERLRSAELRVWLVSPKPPDEGGFDEWELPSPAGAGEAGRRPGEGRGAGADSIPAKVDPPSLGSSGAIEEGLERSRVLACPAAASSRWGMLCMSAHGFGSDWAQLACPAVASERRRKAGTFRYRDPLNQERRDRNSGFGPPIWKLRLSRA